MMNMPPRCSMHLAHWRRRRDRSFRGRCRGTTATHSQPCHEDQMERCPIEHSHSPGAVRSREWQHDLIPAANHGMVCLVFNQETCSTMAKEVVKHAKGQNNPNILASNSPLHRRWCPNKHSKVLHLDLRFPMGIVLALHHGRHTPIELQWEGNLSWHSCTGTNLLHEPTRPR